MMQTRLDGFDDYVTTAMQEWRVPGCAVAIVSGGEVVFSRGFGYRDVQNRQAATEDTLFAIASCTKPFTATALGILVDDGKLDWDTPVRDYLPAFRLRDPFASERCTARDFLTHRSGLPRHDLIWYHGSLTRGQIFDGLRYLESNKDFRTTWQYQSLLYVAAGVLVEELSGSAWAAFVKRRIFEPLGMRHSNFSVADSQQDSDSALPYEEQSGAPAALPYLRVDAAAPAGGINSCVRDMARWVLLNLGGGAHDGHRVISESTLRHMQQPHMVMPPDDLGDEFGPRYCGMGWFLGAYRGHAIIQHGGDLDGFVAQVALLPQSDSGIVVLANKSGTPLPLIVTWHAFDRMLGLNEIPWSDRLRDQTLRNEEATRQARMNFESSRKSGKHPSHPLPDYTGRFDHPAYGTIRVRLESDGLKAGYGWLSISLDHYHYDVFCMNYKEGPAVPRKVTFFTDPDGAIDRLSIPLEPQVNPIVFERVNAS